MGHVDCAPCLRHEMRRTQLCSESIELIAAYVLMCFQAVGDGQGHVTQGCQGKQGMQGAQGSRASARAPGLSERVHQRAAKNLSTRWGHYASSAITRLLSCPEHSLLAPVSALLLPLPPVRRFVHIRSRLVCLSRLISAHPRAAARLPRRGQQKSSAADMLSLPVAYGRPDCFCLLLD